MKIVCIGSSTVNGFPLRRSQSWPSVLASLTGQVIINKGVNGSTSSDMLNRFPKDVLLHKPQIVLIMAGTNDFILKLNSPEGVFANVIAMIKLAQFNNIKPIIVTSLPIDVTQAETSWAIGSGIDYACVQSELLVLHDLIIQYSKAYGIELSDFYQLVFDLMEKESSKELFMDGIHPTAAVHELLARSIIF